MRKKLDKQDFIEKLASMSDEDIQEYIKQNGKFIGKILILRIK